MVKITCLGDIMLDNAMAKDIERYRNGANGEFNFDCVFSHLKRLLENSDYVLANLETPISNEDTDLTSKMWEFNSPVEFADSIKRSGVNCVSTANNHCMDRDVAGLASTIMSLNTVGLDHCGTQLPGESRYCVTDIGSMKIGFLSYTYGTNAVSNGHYLKLRDLGTVNLLQMQEGRMRALYKRVTRGHLIRVFNGISNLFYPDNCTREWYERRTLDLHRKLQIARDIKMMEREKVDYTIVYLHIGGQYNSVPTDYTIETADWFSKRGCDAVICNHEHVVHGTKCEQDRIIAYALGNCLGSAGVAEGPFDKYSEYSIALHLYLNECKKLLERVTFSVLKTSLNEGRFEVWPAYDLFISSRGYQAESIEHDTLAIAKLFSGNEYTTILDEFTMTGAGGCL